MDDDAKLSPEAMRSMRRIMAASRIEDLKCNCSELSEWFASLSENDREKMRVLLLGPED